MPLNASRVDRTTEFLRGLGVKHVGVDRLRLIGRGTGDATISVDREPPLTELCGHCWEGSVSVSADGNVSPCIMSRAWPVGSVRERSLSDICGSLELHQLRSRIYEEVWRSRATQTGEASAVQESIRESACNPACSPNCVPSCNPQCSPNCSPCYPAGKCDPQLFCGPCGPGR